nr:conjugal transfer protein TraD [Stenotrophomonas bentonitica]
MLVAEKQEKERKARQAAKERAKERAALFRSKDAHRKIVLGGLVIAAEADDWDPAEVVGALLVIASQLEREPQRREALREKGIRHLEERAAAREASRS